MSDLSQAPEQVSGDLLSRSVISLINLDWEKTIYLAFFILALITRLWGVGDRVVSHDESLHTQYSYQYYNGDGYNHTPLMHGPSLFHATALSYWLFGVSDSSARIPVAILGSLLILLPYFFRGWLGRVGAIVASFVLLISPYITYYSRYIRHEIYVITAAVITFIAILYYLRHRKDKYLWWLALGIGLMFATMETSFIYVAIFGSFLVLALAAKILVADWFREILPKVTFPLILLLIAILVLVAGFGVQEFASRAADATTPEATVTAEEGFAADPDEVIDSGDLLADVTAIESAMRWVQFGGLMLLALALFLTANSMRPYIDGIAEFDLIVLITTLTLPMATAFLVLMAGGDPLKYNVSWCQLADQGSMSQIQLFIARLSHPDCRSAFFSSGVVLTGAFLVFTLVVSVLVGLWWNMKRWIVPALIFHGIFLLLYTSLFSNPSGWASGMVGSLGYWLAQQEVQRAGQPLYFYFIVLPLYEFLPLIFTLLAARLWAKKQRLNKAINYLIVIIFGALLAYSLGNYFFNRKVVDPSEISKLPGFVLAGLILTVGIIGAIFWVITHWQQITADVETAGGWRKYVDVDALFGFVPYLIWWFLASWLIYSLAGEKMAWLSSHFIFPMTLLTGWYMNDRLVSANRFEILSRRFAIQVGLIALFIIALALALSPLILGQLNIGSQEVENLNDLGRFLGSILILGILVYFLLKSGRQLERGTRRRAWLMAIFGLLSLLTIRATYMANFPNADYTNEFLVYAHGAPATKSEVTSQLEGLSMRLAGDKSIKVAYDNDSSWPFTWYLRDYPNRVYFSDNPGRNITESPVVIAGSQNWGKVEPILGDDYETRTYTFLWWPMEEYRNISWNSVFGDPKVDPEFRRGLAKPEVRQALADIILHRDYENYGEVFGGTYTAGQWPLRRELRMYIRKDSLATIWDHGIDAVAAEPPVDPYAANDLQLSPIQVIGNPGSGEGQFLQPRNLAFGPDGTMFVADSGNHRIQVFDSDGWYLRDWGSFGESPGMFNEPWGLAVDDEFVYVADTWNHRLQKFTLDGEFAGIIGQSGSPSEGQEGGGLFFGPRDIVILPDGNLLITDTGNHRLQILDSDGNFVKAIGSQGNLLGQFYEPVGLTLNEEGLVYVADTWNERIQAFDTELLPVGEWPVDAWLGDSINNKPYLSTDSLGRVYVSDPEGYRIILFDDSGQYLARFGQYSTTTDGFSLPNGIKVAGNGNIYVVDSGNSHILVFSPVPQELPDPESGFEFDDPALEHGGRGLPLDDSPQG